MVSLKMPKTPNLAPSTILSEILGLAAKEKAVSLDTQPQSLLLRRAMWVGEPVFYVLQVTLRPWVQGLTMQPCGDMEQVENVRGNHGLLSRPASQPTLGMAGRPFPS